MRPTSITKKSRPLHRQSLTPSSALPLAYFGVAHAALALAFLTLAIDPALPGSFYLHPRMAALVHAVTTAWISGSILGAFYIVAPLALGLPLPVRRSDWLLGAAFSAGSAGLVAQFWTGRYGGMAWTGALVLAAPLWVGARAALGLRVATAPWPVLLHVMLAFANMIAAALVGVLVALDRAYGLFGLPPLAAAVAHLHLAAIGWPVMMVVGLAYRLVPMFRPSRMPAGTRLAASAVGLELGLIALVVALLTERAWIPAGALLIAAGLVSFAWNMRTVITAPLTRPPALPRHDWSTWQAQAALGWMLVAATLGAILAVTSDGPWRIAVAWVYGVAGLLGFIAQIVTGIQGRLVPLYAYYRAMAELGGQPPARAANSLPTPRFAGPIFWLWAIGVPGLAWGLSTGQALTIRLSALVLMTGVIVGAAYLAYLMRAARSPGPARRLTSAGR